MPYFDYHCHSLISADGSISINKVCAEIIKRGGNGVTFTEHLEVGDGVYEGWELDYNQYKKEITAARAAYPELVIGMGAEVGLQVESKEKIIAAVMEHEWDFVIGSVHVIGGKLTYDGEFSAGKSREEAYRGYFHALCEAAAAFPVFDVMGHIDLIRRDYTFSTKTLEYRDFADEFDTLFRILIDSGRGIEVNTAGRRYFHEAHPPLSCLKRYKELGGEIITCGSDSHSLPSVFHGIREGYELIREAGFKYITVFEKRKPKQIKI